MRGRSLTHREGDVLRVLWLATVCFALALGMASLGRRMQQRPRVPVSPVASSEAMLAGLGPGPVAAKVRSELAALPAGEVVMLVGSAGDPFYLQTLFALSYLAYPRPMGGVTCGEDDHRLNLAPPVGSRVAALLVLAQREVPGSVRLARGLAMVPVVSLPSETWTSFCSPLLPPSS